MTRERTRRSTAADGERRDTRTRRSTTRKDHPRGVHSQGRAQAHTLEAVVAAMILIAGIGFALQMTAVTPLSASTSSQHLENQLQSSGQGVLASSAESGELRRAVLYYDGSTEQFHGADNEGYYTTNLDANEFTRALDRVYGPRNVAYNVYVVFHTGDGETERERMVYQGEPSDHAVSASRTVTLVDDDNLTASDGTAAATTVAGTDGFYAPDAGNGTALYNHVRVEVVAWRI